MPMIDLTLPQGALSEDAKAKVVEQLTTSLIRFEGAPDNEYVRAIAWCFLDERPAGAIHVGGRAPGRPVYRLVLTVPEGAPGVSGPLLLGNRDLMVRTMTEHVLAAEGTPYSEAEAARVWVQIREIRDGYWGAMGEIGRMHDIATIAGALPEDQRTERGLRGRTALEAAALA